MPKDFTKNTGVLAPIENDREYVFGAISGIVHQELNTTRDWRQFEPTGEKQRYTKFDTYGCVSFSGSSDCEMQFNLYLKSGLLRNEDIEWLKFNGYFDEKGFINFSDRWLVVLSNTKPGVGNYISAVWDAARKYGLVPQSIVPFREDMTQVEYYKSDFSKAAYDLGKEFLKRFIIQYERVNINEVDLKKALGQAPLQVGLATCSWEEGTVVQFCGRAANHATLITCIDDLYRWVFDSYTNYIDSKDFKKKLAKGYPVDFAYKGIVIPIISVGSTKPKEQYSFQKNLKFGDFDNEVVKLCERLIQEDSLPSNFPYSPHYGVEVAKAVRHYQQKNKITNWWEDLVYRGRYFGKKTRFSLNMTNPNLF